MVILYPSSSDVPGMRGARSYTLVLRTCPTLDSLVVGVNGYDLNVVRDKTDRAAKNGT